MSYGFNDDQMDFNKPFPLSANNEHVYLENAEYSLVKDEYEAIDLNWAKPDGSRIRQRIFAVDENKTTAFSGMSLEDTIKQKYNQINTALFRVGKAFDITKPELQNAVAGTKGFKQFASAVAKLLNERSAGKEVKLKTILDKKGYVKVPNLGEFVLSMDDSKELQYTKWELKNNAEHANKRPKKKAEEVTDDPEITVDETEDPEVAETEWYAEDL